MLRLTKDEKKGCVVCTSTKRFIRYATFDKGRKEGVCGLYIHKKVYKGCYVRVVTLA